jgi:hypothetical protein
LLHFSAFLNFFIDLRTPNSELIFSLIHYLDGNVRTIALALVASDTTRLLYNLIHLKGENPNRTDLHTDDTSLAVKLIPEDI